MTPTGLGQDLRFAWRNLTRTPAFTAIVVGTLALVIGGTTAAFSITDAALFRPLPFRDPERLVAVWNLRVPFASLPLRSNMSIVALRARKDVFDAVGAYSVGGLNLTGAGEPMRVTAAALTPDVFQMLGVRPVAGRLFTDDDSPATAPDVVVLSQGLWRRQFGGDERILGKKIELNGRPFEVVGVMSPRFTFPSNADLWIPMSVPLTFARLEFSGILLNVSGIARLAAGLTPQQANARLVTPLEDRASPAASREPPAEVLVPIREGFASGTAPRIRIVATLVLLALVAGCTNVSGLLVARGNGRRREMAIRTAIGAGRSRLIRQLLTESVLLAAAGAVAGAIVALLAMKIFSTLVDPELIALTPPHLDLRVLAATLILTAGTALGCGVVPAFAATRHPPGEVLKAVGAGSSTRRGARRLSSMLVAVEVALAVVLLVGSGLMIRSLVHLFAVDTGIRSEGVVTARVALPRVRYATSEARRQFFTRVTQALSRVPGVTAAAAVNTLPLRGELVAVLMTDVVGPDSVSGVPAEHVIATTDYFAAMGIRLVAGRVFAAGRVDHVAVVSESFARQLRVASPLGTRVRVMNDSIPREIVGVVSDVTSTTLDGKRENQIYLPLEDSPYPQATIVVRGSLPSAALMTQIRVAVREIDPQQPIYGLATMSQVMRSSVAARRASGLLTITFGALALALAGIGVYGLLTFAVSQRLPELGIRLALGAQPSDIVRLIVRNGLAVTTAGIIVGAAAAFAFSRVMRSLLFEVRPTDPVVFAIVPLVLFAVALIAAYAPARRAAAVDPLSTIRSE